MRDSLQHYGIKGMKWGVRRPTNSNGLVVKKPGRIKKEVGSVVREVKSAKSLRNLSNMTDQEIREKSTRLNNENRLKDLTKVTGIPTSKKFKKRDEYLLRGDLSDSELKARVDRLQIEANLKKKIKTANKERMDIANKVINDASKKALDKFTDDKGNFSATGRDEIDIVIRRFLKYSKSNDVIK